LAVRLFIVRFIIHNASLEEFMAGLQQRITRASYDKLKGELENLKGQRGGIINDIKEAREQGDLRENFAYHAAKDAQGLLEARISSLEARLANSVVMEEGEINEEVVLGVPVQVRNKTSDTERTYIIVSSEELDDYDDAASADSPVGEALLGKKVGDIAEVQGPNGIVEFEVLSIGE
jgi:transcription elongation factor GreA